jgi:ATP-dependent DNA helicase RecG
MRGNDSEDPSFETDQNRTSFLVRLPLRVAPKVEPIASIEGSTSGRATLKAPTVDPKVAGGVTLSMARMILTLCEEARRPSDLHTRLQTKDRITLLYGYLTPLMVQGWLVRTQPWSPNSPTQRYLTTPAGRVWLVEHPE